MNRLWMLIYRVILMPENPEKDRTINPLTQTLINFQIKSIQHNKFHIKQWIRLLLF